MHNLAVFDDQIDCGKRSGKVRFEITIKYRQIGFHAFLSNPMVYETPSALAAWYVAIRRTVFAGIPALCYALTAERNTGT